MKLKHTLLIISIAALLSGCADKNPLTEQGHSPAGFFHGWWHDACAPFALIGIMFGANVGVYEPLNTGNWYNLGFLLGIGALSVSGSSAKK